MADDLGIRLLLCACLLEQMDDFSPALILSFMVEWSGYMRCQPLFGERQSRLPIGFPEMDIGAPLQERTNVLGTTFVHRIDQSRTALLIACVDAGTNSGLHQLIYLRVF